MQEVRVRKIRRTGVIPNKVYNLTVSGNHNFFVNGFLTHNCDDPHQPIDVASDRKRQNGLDWYDQTWLSRRNDPETARELVIMQRLHHQDLTGHLLGKGGWELLKLPTEAPRRVTISLNDFKKTREAGELLHPDRITPDEVIRLRQDSFFWSSQHQQEPSPLGGGMLKSKWFQWWKQDKPPKIDFTIQSWDTAISTSANAAYSACTTWGVFTDLDGIPNVIMLGMWRKRCDFPELYTMAQKLSRDYRYGANPDLKEEDDAFKPDIVLVEAKANGLSLIQTLARGGVIATRFDPNKYGDKIGRVRLIQHIIEAGRVWLPAMAPAYTQLRPYANDFLNEASKFPASDTKDAIDSFSQALIRLRDSGWVWHPHDTAAQEHGLPVPELPAFYY